MLPLHQGYQGYHYIRALIIIVPTQTLQRRPWSQPNACLQMLLLKTCREKPDPIRWDSVVASVLLSMSVYTAVPVTILEVNDVLMLH